MAGGSKSKNKGSGAERELCKYLSEIFGGSFIRSANSGAFVGGFNAARKANLSKTQIAGQKGDIIPPDHMSKLVLESKFYKEFRFHQLLQPGPVPQLDEWIKQCLDASDEGDLWLICFKINLRGWFVLLPETKANDFVFTNYSVYVGGQYGTYRVTDLKEFCSVNKDAVLRLSA
jgi:Holliday junction resolvase